MEDDFCPNCDGSGCLTCATWEAERRWERLERQADEEHERMNDHASKNS